MTTKPQRISQALARSLYPLSELTAENLSEVMDKAVLQEVQAGRILFKRGEGDNKSLYVLSGEVVLAAEGVAPVLVAAGSRAARQPLDPHQPHRATATARTKLTVMAVDNDLLDVLLNWEQDAGYVVTELDADDLGGEDGDWMTQILGARIFQRIPSANLHALFTLMEPVPVRAGDRVVQQGDEGDYYYFIHRGRARVTRRGADGQESVLAELNAGQAFGEEALIADQKRNASVVMAEDGQLMRLSKAAFEQLLKAPVLSAVDFARAAALVRDGARLLDVRPAAEHARAHLRGSLNIPLAQLRAEAAKLDPQRPYVVYCDTGARSASAAYLLSAQGLDVYLLDGGLRRLAQMKKAAQTSRSAT
ncbi:cyclic nucleotide-binding domain-containing protein [Ectothiorhodospiraceae bacterium 2226]|nr:cyclic nucleotide-binding domain-containing protein [Ectothiorhodospiraceae bacterium 2226]